MLVSKDSMWRRFARAPNTLLPQACDWTREALTADTAARSIDKLALIFIKEYCHGSHACRSTERRLANSTCGNLRNSSDRCEKRCTGAGDYITQDADSQPIGE